MTIRYSKKFIKQLSKQSAKTQNIVYLRLELFQHNPSEPLLYNHSLKGKLNGLYSINISGDIRALYRSIDDKNVIFEQIGTHSQLYG